MNKNSGSHHRCRHRHRCRSVQRRWWQKQRTNENEWPANSTDKRELNVKQSQLIYKKRHKEQIYIYADAPCSRRVLFAIDANDTEPLHLMLLITSCVAVDSLSWKYIEFQSLASLQRRGGMFRTARLTGFRYLPSQYFMFRCHYWIIIIMITDSMVKSARI